MAAIKPLCCRFMVHKNETIHLKNTTPQKVNAIISAVRFRSRSQTFTFTSQRKL